MKSQWFVTWSMWLEAFRLKISCCFYEITELRTFPCLGPYNHVKNVINA